MPSTSLAPLNVATVKSVVSRNVVWEFVNLFVLSGGSRLAELHFRQGFVASLVPAASSDMASLSMSR